MPNEKSAKLFLSQPAQSYLQPGSLPLVCQLQELINVNL